MPATTAFPGRDCRLCPRLSGFIDTQRAAHPQWYNGPVASFGPETASVLIVGLAPGLRGANRTGRPFTGDYAGDLLYPTLKTFGFAKGEFGATADDGFSLIDVKVTNAVRCVPPENRPTGPEISTCNGFLAEEIRSLSNLRMILALGTIAHGATLGALGKKKSATPFRHGAFHFLEDAPVLVDSYHCSRYNTNTGRLTTAMFEAVIGDIRKFIDAGAE